MERLDFNSWGRVFSPQQTILGMTDRTAALPETAGTLLPYGAGRSYGDSCLNDGNALIRARDLDHLIAFDPVTGVLRCEAGVLLAEIIEFALPKGWFLPVTPGTKFVTVGGAIANDVHGKNHHRAGSFGHFVKRFELLRSDGSRRECSEEDYAELYAATIGGLGLTGLITWAEIRLRRVAGPWLRQRSVRFASLAEFFEVSAPLETQHEYVVAWLDCVAHEEGGTRGIVFAADHDESTEPAPLKGALPFPLKPSASLVNGMSLRAFNELYYRLPKPGATDTAKVCWDPFFYPLDRIQGWNKLYGTKGFFQYQCVVPEDSGGREALARLLAAISASGQGSFLTVLKRFGELRSPGLMSFPRPGYTLALDFPNLGDRTLRLLDALDDIVVSVGGRVYAAKDSRMSGSAFRKFYPEWESFARHIDPRFSSSFWRRVTTGLPS